MSTLELIKTRHSVRMYTPEPLRAEHVRLLNEHIDLLNGKSGVRFFLIQDSPAAFDSFFGRYGKFSNARNFFVLAGKKGERAEEEAGYYGEDLVLKAEELGLGTCWVGGTYSKKDIPLEADEKIICVITVGYAAHPGSPRRSKWPSDVVSNTGDLPEWFSRGVEAALLAPTALNQQKFMFSLEAASPATGDKPVVSARVSGFGVFTRLDLGIAKYHFEAGAGRENFVWKE
ncbi:MAG TPA: nitroreductase family protein [Treponemataceae bacterium]|nr:nitroreductase family protein [Treponemataceae bacterium]